MQQLFDKIDWGINDELVIEGVTRKIVEFNDPKNRVKVSYRDNENQIKYRWFDVKDLPPYPTAGEPFLPPAAQEKPKFIAGQRVRLTRDILEETTVHPVNLYKGDEGIVKEHPDDKKLLGFLSDRWGDITSFNKKIDGVTQLVLNFCELIETPSPAKPVGAQSIASTPIVQAPENLKRGRVLYHKVMNYNRVIQDVNGLTVTLAMGDGKVQWDASIFEIREPDAGVTAAMLANFARDRGRIEQLEQQLREKDKRIEAQAASITKMMKSDDAALQDKFEQLTEDYESLEKQKSFVEQERDNLKKVNDQQSELLKQAAAAPPPSPIESRLLSIEEKLDGLEQTLLENRVLKAPDSSTAFLVAFWKALNLTIDSFDNGNSAKLEESDETQKAG